MDLVSTWAMRIAEEAAPDEIDLAPAMAHAYIGGGKDREDLFHRRGDVVLGAFGPDVGVALLPQILDVIQGVGPGLVDFLATAHDAFGGGYYLLGAVNTLLAIGNLSKREKKKESLPDEDPDLGRIRQEYEDAMKTADLIKRELLERGLPENEAELVALRVFRAMLKDPSGAARFTEEIMKAS